jgi:hypothetical protein
MGAARDRKAFLDFVGAEADITTDRDAVYEKAPPWK